MTEIRLVHPLLNLTKLMADELAYIPIDCYEFGVEWDKFWNDLYTALNKDFNIVLQAALLTQLENAKKYRTIIRIIQLNGDQGLQNYLAVFEQYGKLFYLMVFTIRPFRSGALDVSGLEGEQGVDTYAKAFSKILQNVPSKFFTDTHSLQFEDRAMAYIIIFSALGVAWLADMQRQDMFDGVDDQIQNFYNNTLNYESL